MLPFVLRFSLFPGLFFFFTNYCLTLINTLWALLYAIEKPSFRIYMISIFIIEIPIIFLTLLVPPWRFDWASSIYYKFSRDAGLKALIGLLQGFVGLYIYGLGSKMRSNLSSKKVEQQVDQFRAIGNLASVFEMIAALAVFAWQTPYEISWTLRPIILISPIILIAIGLSFGFVYGGSFNYSLIFIGALLTFSISTIIGTMIIQLTTTGEEFYTNFIAFGCNILLSGGLIGYFFSDMECPLTVAVKNKLSKIIIICIVVIIFETFSILLLKYYTPFFS